MGNEVVCLTGDAAGESRKAQKDALIKYPELLGPNCFAHQASNILFRISFGLLDIK